VRENWVVRPGLYVLLKTMEVILTRTGTEQKPRLLPPLAGVCALAITAHQEVTFLTDRVRHLCFHPLERAYWRWNMTLRYFAHGVFAILTCLTCGFPLAASASAIPTQPSFVYVADVGYGIYGYQINSDTGALTMVTGSPFTAGKASDSVVIDPTNRFVYVGDQFNLIYGFQIDRATGALGAPVPGSPVAGGWFYVPPVVHPSGRFLYGLSSVSGGGGIYGYAIDGPTGALTSLGPPTTFTSDYYGTMGFALDPSGKFLFVAATKGGTEAIYAYEVSPTTGALKSVVHSPFSGSGGYPGSPTVHPLGTFLYVPVFGGVTVLSINRSNGSLKEIAGSPFFSSPCDAGEIVIEPSARFAYIVEGGFSGSGQSLCGFAIDASSGALSALASSPYNVSAGLRSIAIDGSGKFVYATSDAYKSTADTWQFVIDSASGALTQAGAPGTAGFAPNSVATTNGFLNFPISGLGPESASISTVFDHSQNGPYQNNSEVVAFTGEIGLCNAASATQDYQSVVGVKHPHSGYRNQTGTAFAVNGNYNGGAPGSSSSALTCAGGSAVSLPSNTLLFYDGHPGYDYPQSCGTPVYAAASGVVSYPTVAIPGYSKANLQTFHVLELDLDSPLGYKLYYLHLSNYTQNNCKNCTCPYLPNVVNGGHVGAGALIGYSGDAGVPGAPHLHFEVRGSNGFPVDPYGWTGAIVPGPDPYKKAINTRLWNDSE